VTSSNRLSGRARPDRSAVPDSDRAGQAASDLAAPPAPDLPPAAPALGFSDPPASDPSRSALADALATVGDRWTLLLIAALLDGPRRFGELQEEVRGIAPNVLTQRLRQLERNALLVARPYSERPPRFVYELSAAGQELAGVLRLLAGWGARNAEGAAAPRHAVCGTPMEARWWCPTCERPVAEDEGDELHFA
jgi:DNA-binding HxlR family transcriptional regulator